MSSTTTTQAIPVAEIIAVEPNPTFPGSYTVLVQCPHCGEAHTHGSSRPDGLDGHRNSHCGDKEDGVRPDSNSVGYYLGGAPADESPTIEVETITPAMAERYLTHNSHNRKLRKGTVATYAHAMERGQWVLNGESIKFDHNGVLVDGQHRLAAIVEAGVPIDVLVIRNVSMESQITVDVGLRRSIADHLGWMGETNTTRLGAALNALYNYRASGRFEGGAAGGATRRSCSYRDLLDLLEECPHIRESVKVAKMLGTNFKVPNGTIAALHYVLWEKEPAEANIFFDLLATGVGLDVDSPIYVLRRVMEKNDRETRRMSTRHLMALIVKAWNLWISGESCRLLKFTTGGSSPEKFPVITFPPSA